MYTVAHSNSAMSAADDVYYKVVQHLHVDKLVWHAPKSYGKHIFY